MCLPGAVQNHSLPLMSRFGEDNMSSYGGLQPYQSGLTHEASQASVMDRSPRVGHPCPGVGPEDIQRSGPGNRLPSGSGRFDSGSQ